MNVTITKDENGQQNEIVIDEFFMNILQDKSYFWLQVQKIPSKFLVFLKIIKIFFFSVLDLSKIFIVNISVNTQNFVRGVI